jgi:Tfp pilus assembly protein PilF
MNTDKKAPEPRVLKESVGPPGVAAGQTRSPKESGPQNPFSSGSIGVHRWLVPLVLALLTLAVYWPVRHHAFINYDDPDYVTENRHVQAGLSRPGLAWAFFNLHGEHTYWHPLTWVSHMLDCQLFGVNPGAHHLVNVVFHIANTLLLLLVLNRMTGAFWRSAMVAALFALHPLQVDTVAWVTERKNVLSTLFWLLTLWAYVRFAECRRKNAECRIQQQEPPKAQHTSRFTFHVSRFYLLSLAFFALGLMCKPALVTLPIVLLLLDYWPLRRFEVQSPESKVQGQPLAVLGPLSWASHDASRITHHVSLVTLRRLIVEKLPFLVLAAAAAFITIAGNHEIRAEGSYGLPWQWRVGNALVSYVRYLGKAFWPSHLAVFYPHPGAWPTWAVCGSTLVLLAVTGWVIWRARQAPYLMTGWLWFLGVLVPMIGLIQAGSQAMADRFAYVPLIGLFIMIVWALTNWAQRGAGFQSGLLAVAGLLALGACVVLTSRQLSFWQNTTTLFEHALHVTRNNSCAHFSLGNQLADQGKIEDAMQHWESALKLEPARPDVHARIAGALSLQGDFAGAIARYRHALQIDPDHAEVLNNVAWLLATCPEASLRDGPEAVRLALKACELTRFRRTIMVGTLAAAHAEAGRFPEAVETAQQACALAADEGDGALLAKNQELLELYRASKPYHEPAAPPARRQ